MQKHYYTRVFNLWSVSLSCSWKPTPSSHSWFTAHIHTMAPLGGYHTKSIHILFSKTATYIYKYMPMWYTISSFWLLQHSILHLTVCWIKTHRLKTLNLWWEQITFASQENLCSLADNVPPVPLEHLEDRDMISKWDLSGISCICLFAL